MLKWLNKDITIKRWIGFIIIILLTHYIYTVLYYSYHPAATIHPTVSNTNLTIQEYAQTIPNHTNYDFYTYQIVESNGNELIGIPLDHISAHNQNVYLFKDELNINFKVGDKVLVVFEKEFDDVILEVKQLNE